MKQNLCHSALFLAAAQRSVVIFNTITNFLGLSALIRQVSRNNDKLNVIIWQNQLDYMI